MRHRVRKNRLAKKPHQSRMILRNLLTSVILYENVRTTKKRAELVQPLIDKVITIAKKDNPVLAVRRIRAMVTDDNASRKALEVLVARYPDRVSGYTRAKPAGMRGGDGAALVDLSFVEGKDVTPPAKKEKTPKAAKSAK